MKLKTMLTTFVSVILITLLTLPVFAQDKESKANVIAETMVETYQIGIGDILEITTWKEEDFTRENVMVRTDGKISFPLLNDFPAAGLSPMELKYNIEKGLKAFVDHPVVTVHIINTPVIREQQAHRVGHAVAVFFIPCILF